jgi:hypothetical protein
MEWRNQKRGHADLVGVGAGKFDGHEPDQHAIDRRRARPRDRVESGARPVFEDVEVIVAEGNLE